MARWLAGELRVLLIMWLLLTLPVVCHHETTVAMLNAVAAGHQHQHMASGRTHEPPQAHAAQHHAHGGAALAEAPLAPALPAATPQWRSALPTPAHQGSPAGQDGPALWRALATRAPDEPDALPRAVEPATPEGQRRAPPSPPPRLLPA